MELTRQIVNMNQFKSELVQADLAEITANLDDLMDDFNDKHVLITGGAGFLGYYLVYFFNFIRLHHGVDVKVSVTDNFIRGKPSWIIDAEYDFKGFLDVITHDIVKDLPSSLKNANINYIIHAASIASPIVYRRFPIETMDANVIGLRKLLDYCDLRARNNSGIDGFLFFSSSEIYGNPTAEYIPTPEHYNGNVSCTGPRACYDESKRFGETLCVNFAKEKEIPVTIARPFNNYGPGLKLEDGRVIPDFARNLLDGENIVLLSDGKASRTFCYITDAISGYLRILVKGELGQAYNIGTDSPEVTIVELAEEFSAVGRKMFGSDIKVEFKTSEDPEYNTDNPERRCPDIKLARSLGYKPTVTLTEGLQRTLVWYKICRELQG